MIKIWRVYESKHGYQFRVLDTARSGTDCSKELVIYENIEDTADFPAGTHWALPKEEFLEKMKETDDECN